MAMARPSPSASGSSRRRLSEVLSEQQEPFSLDLYLLEKGCSPAFVLDAATCGGGAFSTCWPGSSSTGRTLRRPARRKKGSRGSGVLRLLLSKILSGRTKAPPAAAKKRQQPAKAIDWRRVDQKQRRSPEPEQLMRHALPSPRHAVDIQHVEDDGDGEQEEGDEEDEASKKQLSPVSVLEQRLFEHSPAPPHAQKALVIFSELLEAAYTPASLLDLLAHARDDYRSIVSTKSKAGGASPTTPRTRRRKNKKEKEGRHAHARHAHREEEEDDTAALLEKDLGRVSALVASELGGARVRAAELRASRQDVGAAVAAAVLEALTEETAAELLVTTTMGVDQDCAVDTARC